jgi:hypothetical protein
MRALGGPPAESGLKLLLDHPGRGRRPAGEVEDGQHRVAGHVDDPALERFDLAAEHRPSGIERLHRGPFVCRHEARVAGGIRREDRRQALAEARAAHTPRFQQATYIKRTSCAASTGLYASPDLRVKRRIIPSGAGLVASCRRRLPGLAAIR